MASEGVSPEGGAGADPAVKDEARGAPPAGPPPKAWGAPLLRLQERWTALEVRLIAFVLAWQLASLVAWVVLSGLASRPAPDSPAGSVLRSALGGLALGGAAWGLSRKQPLATRRVATVAAIAIGLALGPAWKAVGVGYFDNVKGWLQEGSTLTLIGGLRGLATRLTLWLALLGGSLATGLGKHIHVDLIARFLPKAARRPIALANHVAAACVCAAAAWGFFDFNAIQSYGASADAPAGQKLALTAHEIGDHAFLLRKQIGLDLRTLPHVLAGERYDAWMTSADWRAWVKSAGFEERYGVEATARVAADDADMHAPLVVSPTGTSTRGCLTEDLNLVFPFGLLAIALRFVLRTLLTLSGHASADPEEAVREEIAELSHAEGGA